LIRHPYANVFMCQFALVQALAACARVPDNDQYRLALGVAQYRLGKFQKDRDGTEVQLRWCRRPPSHGHRKRTDDGSEGVGQIAPFDTDIAATILLRKIAPILAQSSR
jgi:hypothetical protein